MSSIGDLTSTLDFGNRCEVPSFAQLDNISRPVFVGYMNSSIDNHSTSWNKYMSLAQDNFIPTDVSGEHCAPKHSFTNLFDESVHIPQCRKGIGAPVDLKQSGSELNSNFNTIKSLKPDSLNLGRSLMDQILDEPLFDNKIAIEKEPVLSLYRRREPSVDNKSLISIENFIKMGVLKEKRRQPDMMFNFIRRPERDTNNISRPVRNVSVGTKAKGKSGRVRMLSSGPKQKKLDEFPKMIYF